MEYFPKSGIPGLSSGTGIPGNIPERKKPSFFNCENILILGDFNHELKLGSPLESFMLGTFGTSLISRRESTTNARTVIDEIFGRIEDYNIEVFIYESYSSHHKPLVIRVHEL
ncbi:hypothetical protein PVAND_004100 [Polypedilum vanderplanki]|uniref:Endonuclease/exonuclease/phosphatase n=1 Tax=Polypedilum vanderplanki TaxID=319348 RepID=A0A9J6BX43_POLVA|nr:hypothetical protein PVAND_004100 [Polypedilum vanderplanki]